MGASGGDTWATLKGAGGVGFGVGGAHSPVITCRAPEAKVKALVLPISGMGWPVGISAAISISPQRRTARVPEPW